MWRGSGEAYPESSAIWDSNGKVGEDGEESIRERGFEGEVVGDFVDGQEEILVRCCTNDVGCKEES